MATFDPVDRDDPWFSGATSLDSFGYEAPPAPRDTAKLWTLVGGGALIAIWLTGLGLGAFESPEVPGDVATEAFASFKRPVAPALADLLVTRLGAVPGRPEPAPATVEEAAAEGAEPDEAADPAVVDAGQPPPDAPPDPPPDAPAPAPKPVAVAPVALAPLKEAKPEPPKEAKPEPPKELKTDPKPEPPKSEAKAEPPKLEPKPEPPREEPKPEPPKETKPEPAAPVAPAVSAEAEGKFNALLARAESMLSAGNPKGAINEVKQALKVTPSLKARVLLARAYYQASMSKEATREYEAVLQSNPAHKGALIALGELAQTSNNRGAARRYYQRVIDAYPNSREAAKLKQKILQL